MYQIDYLETCTHFFFSDEGMNHENGIMLLNFVADYWDLLQQYNLLNKKNNTNEMDSITKPSCTVMIKYMDEMNDVFMAHNTWHEYKAMSARILKNYKLNFHVKADSDQVIPGHTVAMSSYAGSIASLDEFYLISSGLATTETTLFIYDNELYRDLSPDFVVYEPIRVAVANRLAQFGSQWARMFERENSGTYNNQWMIVDYNKINETEGFSKK